MAFIETFDSFVCEGDTIAARVDGYTVTARVVRDDTPVAPDQRQDGFWPSLDPQDAGFICAGKTDADLETAKAKAKAVMDAWEADEWFYCGIVVCVSRAGITLDDHTASLWGIEANYPDSDNAYLTEVARACARRHRRRADRAGDTMRGLRFCRCGGARMTRYIVHWLERGAHTPSETTHADTLAACGNAVEAISLNFARTLWNDADEPEGFAARVRADALEAVQRTEPGRADDPQAPSVIIDFPIRLQRCGTLWATPCLVVVPVRSEAVA